jgi:membrane dipeptidase
MRLIFDGHADLAWIALAYNRDLTQSIAQINQHEIGMEREKGWGDAISCLPEIRRGAIAVCLGTLFARVNRNAPAPTQAYRRTDYDFRTQSMAYAVAQGQLAYYRQLESEGEMVIIRTADDLGSHWQNCLNTDSDHWPIGNIIAMEGADPIACPRQVEEWFADGLRSIMLAHYGNNQYAAGTGGEGPLTDHGLELLKECERVGIILDLSHLSDRSFFQAAEQFNGPVMASHSNCRALVPGNRQLSDQQLRLLIERDAVIGIACDAWMLVAGWQIGVSQPDGLTRASMVDHLDHICQLAGNVRLWELEAMSGPPMEPSSCSADFKSIADLQRLAELLAQRGYSSADIDAVFHGNWLRFFRSSLPTSI